jgi:hypothetical protein
LSAQSRLRENTRNAIAVASGDETKTVVLHLVGPAVALGDGTRRRRSLV